MASTAHQHPGFRPFTHLSGVLISARAVIRISEDFTAQAPFERRSASTTQSGKYFRRRMARSRMQWRDAAWELYRLDAGMVRIESYRWGIRLADSLHTVPDRNLEPLKFARKVGWIVAHWISALLRLDGGQHLAPLLLGKSRSSNPAWSWRRSG